MSGHITSTTTPADESCAANSCSCSSPQFLPLHPQTGNTLDGSSSSPAEEFPALVLGCRCKTLSLALVPRLFLMLLLLLALLLLPVLLLLPQLLVGAASPAVKPWYSSVLACSDLKLVPNTAKLGRCNSDQLAPCSSRTNAHAFVYARNNVPQEQQCYGRADIHHAYSVHESCDTSYRKLSKDATPGCCGTVMALQA